MYLSRCGCRKQGPEEYSALDCPSLHPLSLFRCYDYLPSYVVNSFYYLRKMRRKIKPVPVLVEVNIFDVWVINSFIPFPAYMQLEASCTN